LGCFCNKNQSAQSEHWPLAGCFISASNNNVTLDPNDGNATSVSATLGRSATLKCVANNLVGQKTVNKTFYLFL
jgi:hypothetical protein